MSSGCIFTHSQLVFIKLKHLCLKLKVESQGEGGRGNVTKPLKLINNGIARPNKMKKL